MESCPTGYVSTELGCIAQDPSKFSSDVYGIGLGLMGGVALIAIMYGGFLILSSRGDQGLLNKGKDYITYAIIGIVLAVGGYFLYRLAAADILKIPGFNG